MLLGARALRRGWPRETRGGQGAETAVAPRGRGRRVLVTGLASCLLSLAAAGPGSGASFLQARSGLAARDTVWAWLGERCGRLAAMPLAPYPWPIAPFHRQHPVRGYFGDPRTVITGVDEGAFSFHNGVDISARPGTHVFPVVSGIVVRVPPGEVVVAAAHERRFQYIHIDPWVRVGARVVASRTVLGVVLPITDHVHLSEIRGMCVVNPLLRGHLTPFADPTRPVVRAIVFETPTGRRIAPGALTGMVRAIANAYDRPALPSPYPWRSLPVSPALVRWTLTSESGSVVRGRVAADFRVSLPPRRDFHMVYARGTVQNFAAVLGKLRWGQPGRYLFNLTPGPLDTALLPNGRYRFTVVAANIRGGTGTRSVSVTIGNPRREPVAGAALEGTRLADARGPSGVRVS